MHLIINAKNARLDVSRVMLMPPIASNAPRKEEAITSNRWLLIAVLRYVLMDSMPMCQITLVMTVSTTLWMEYVCWPVLLGISPKSIIPKQYVKTAMIHLPLVILAIAAILLMFRLNMLMEDKIFNIRYTCHKDWVILSLSSN